ncbi:hypothetical protein IAR55_002868 [Kwoniella newhampshirensis]|uniref:Alpha 1,6-mannosyltransferase n=1 Tax=Kwoniella newhampshirensis TaxID=1651941 RepID=A0AAW0YNV7_9TREE
MLSTILHRPVRYTFAATLILGLILLSTFHSTRPSSASLTHHRSAHLDHERDWMDGTSVRLEDIVDAATSSLESRVREFDHDAAKRDLGIDIGSGITLERYKADLQSNWNEFFHPSSSGSSTGSQAPSRGTILDKALSKLSLLPDPSVISDNSSEAIPKFIYTTDLAPPDQLPDQFQSWITQNEDWATMFVSDEQIDEWLERSLNQGKDVDERKTRTETEMIQESGGRTGDSEDKDEIGVVEEMKSLKGDWGVVRADLFRYLVLLLNGGIYTDSDTASVLPISQWARNPIQAQSPVAMLEVLPRLLRMAHSAWTGVDDVGFQTILEPEGHDRDGGPSLLVALEIDAPDSGTNWREEGFVRGIQIAQWTIMAKKGHPVLLDVVGRALRRGKEVKDGGNRDVNILDWSGPGAFTDAVLRYLLVRYGFHPSQVSRLTEPIQIGDVVIMPVHSFRADASEGFQGDHRVVWHGFFGRWKGGE